MSSGSGKRVIGGRGENDVVSSSPPAARTRAQTRADRTKMNLNVISPRSTTVKATIVVQDRGELAPAVCLSRKEVPRRPGINYGQVVIPLHY